MLYSWWWVVNIYFVCVQKNIMFRSHMYTLLSTYVYDLNQKHTLQHMMMIHYKLYFVCMFYYTDSHITKTVKNTTWDLFIRTYMSRSKFMVPLFICTLGAQEVHSPIWGILSCNYCVIWEQLLLIKWYVYLYINASNCFHKTISWVISF